MSTQFWIRTWAVSVFLMVVAPTMAFSDGTPAAEEWIDVEVVINVLDGADAKGIDEALAKANEAFKKAKVRLVNKATDPNAKADGDGSGALDRDERDKAREEGQKTLDKTTGAGKGVKIDIGSDVSEDDPNTNGLSIHRDPVILVEPDADSNIFGWTIAHELGHVFTLGYDLSDPNDIRRLMYGYTDRGTDLDPNEVDEIRKGAKKRGTSYFIVPSTLPGQGVAVPPGIEWSVKARGGILDDFSDVRIIDPRQRVKDQRDPTIQYADIREVTAFVDAPFDPSGCLEIDVQLGPAPAGKFSVQSSFDIQIAADPNDPIGVQVELQDWRVISVVWVDKRGPTTVPVDVIVQRNDEYVGNGKLPVFHDRSLEIHIPIEIVALQLTSAEPITVRVQSGHLDYRQGTAAPPIQLLDQTGPFICELERPCHCPGLTFYRSGPSQLGVHPVNVSGCGFIPGRNVELLLDEQRIGQTGVLDDGSFVCSNIPVTTKPGQVHSVIAREIEDSVRQGGATWAPGFFILDPSGPSGPKPVVPPQIDCTRTLVFDPSTGEVKIVVDCNTPATQ